MKKSILCFLLLMSVFMAGCGDKNKTYKVEKINGVPFMTENGNPVRSRILWISTEFTTPRISHPLFSVANQWRDYDFQFVAPFDANAILQLRMGEEAGVVKFSKIEVSRASDGKILSSIKFDGEKLDPKLGWWCAGFKKNPPIEIKNVKDSDAPNGALSVSIIKEEEYKLLNGFHFYLQKFPIKKGESYKVSIRGKSDKVRRFGISLLKNDGTGYEPIANDTSVGMSQFERATKVGVDYVSFEIDSVWTPKGKEDDFRYIDRTFKELLKVNPKAKLIPRIRLDPQAHKWWRDSHKDDLMKNSDGSTNENYVAISSPVYQREALESLKKFIDYCEKNYPENMAGYHPAGGNSREWFYGGTSQYPMSGYDSNTLKAWREWTQKKYSSIEKLNVAWNAKFANFDEIQVPTRKEREAPNALINLKTERSVADFNVFLQDEMSDFLLEMAKLIRKTAPRKLSIFFFGYGFEHANVQNSPAFSGHYMLEKLLKSTDIDAFAGPISYTDRNLGDGKTTMGATESITNAGKLWIDEDDTTTHLGTMAGRWYPGKYSEIKTLEDSLNALRRNLAQETIRNTGVWWMDLRGHGWFDNDDMWNLMKNFEKIESDFIKNPVPYRPEMRLVMDEMSMMMVGARKQSRVTTDPLMYKGRSDANRSGVPFGHYLLDDILKTPKEAKLNVFLSAYALDSKQRARMAKLREKSSCVFAWATGLIDLDKNEFSLDAVKEATGFEVVYVENATGEIFATSEGEKMGLPSKIGNPKYGIQPRLSPKLEKGDVVLATYSNKTPAIVLRKTNGVFSLFYGAFQISSAIYRAMAELSGAHIYTRSNDCVYSNGAYVSFVATSDGMKEIDFGTNKKIYDALTEKEITTQKGFLKQNMKKGDCIFFRIGNGN